MAVLKSKPTLTVPRKVPRGCSPAGARCVSALDPAVRTNPCCVAHNLHILADVARVLDREGIPWAIGYGTLLGWCVNRGFYWNDKDCDINCLVDDRERVRALTDEWSFLGYHVKYHQPTVVRQPSDYWAWGDAVKVCLSPTNKTNTDITFWHRREDGFLDRVSYGPSDKWKGRECPEDWMFPTTRAEFDGIMVNVPAQPEKLVEHIYGPDWRSLPAARHGEALVP